MVFTSSAPDDEHWYSYRAIERRTKLPVELQSSLVRRIIDASGADLSSGLDGRTLGEALLAPTRIYVKPLLSAMKTKSIKGLAHITGGGLVENVPRVLPQTVVADLRKDAWPRLPVFDWLQRNGNVAESEMHRVFNCGIGMVAVVDPGRPTRSWLAGTRGESLRVGEIRARRGSGPGGV
jgi:phosphoribosylformylglycinamidine cyclo-ligase